MVIEELIPQEIDDTPAAIRATLTETRPAAQAAVLGAPNALWPVVRRLRPRPLCSHPVPETSSRSTPPPSPTGLGRSPALSVSTI